MKLAVGIGLSSRAEADEIVALVTSCLAGLRGEVEVLVSSRRKAGNVALSSAAERLGAPLVLLDDATLARQDVPHPSRVAEARTGLDGVAEAAALHFGPLLVGTTKSAHATCAIAEIAP